MRYVLPQSGDRIGCPLPRVGLLAGSILPSCLPIWLISLALIAAGLVLFQR